MTKRQPSTVPAGPVVEHIETLHREGVALAAIASACGVSYQSIWALRSGQAARTKRATAERVLALDVDSFELRNHLLVDAAPVREHVRELVRSGCTLAGLAKAAGVGHGMVWLLERGQTVRVGRTNADRLLALRSDQVDRTSAPRVDSGPVREHILLLLGSGWSLKAVIRDSGVARTTIRMVRAGTQVSVARPDAERVLALGPAGMRTLPVLEDASPVRVHVAALLSAGYPVAEVARASGVSPGTVRKVLRNPDSQVHPETAEQLLGVSFEAHGRGLGRPLGQDRHTGRP